MRPPRRKVRAPSAFQPIKYVYVCLGCYAKQNPNNLHDCCSDRRCMSIKEDDLIARRDAELARIKAREQYDIERLLKEKKAGSDAEGPARPIPQGTKSTIACKLCGNRGFTEWGDNTRTACSCSLGSVWAYARSLARDE